MTACSSGSSASRIYSLTSIKSPSVVVEHGSICESVAWDHTGSFIASAFEGGIDIHSYKKPEMPVVTLQMQEKPKCLKFANDSSFLLVGGDDRNLRFFEMK
jgi:hypothetical protein